MDELPAALGGGLAGTVAMVVVVVGAEALTPYEFRAPETLAGLVNAPEAAGLGLFVVAGVVLWPLLFVSLGRRLPGPGERTRALLFVGLLWVAYVIGFSELAIRGGPPFDPRGDLLAFLVTSLVGHALYGLGLGTLVATADERRTRAV